MGLFLALSGLIGAEPKNVKRALSDFALSHNGGFELKVERSTNDPNIGVITRNGPNTTVMYPDGFLEWNEASRFLSEKLLKPVFSLHIHDGDFWMYVLYQDGKEVGWFNPVPEYWEELPLEEKERWKGDAALIAELIPSLSTGAILNYFSEWNLDEENPTKAYPDDDFTNSDCWQMCDFMKKIGLEYPLGDDGSMHGDTFRFWTKEFRLHQQTTPQPLKSKKPWWRLW